MRSFLPSPRRLLAIAGGVTAGLLAVGAVGTAAYACDSNLKAKADCSQATWTYSTDWTVNVISATIDGKELPESAAIHAGQTITTPQRVWKSVDITQSLGGATKATMKLHVKYGDNSTTPDANFDVPAIAPGNCSGNGGGQECKQNCGGTGGNSDCKPCTPVCDDKDKKKCESPCKDDKDKKKCDTPCTGDKCVTPCTGDQCVIPCKEEPGGKGKCPSSAPSSAAASAAAEASPATSVAAGGATAVPSMSKAANSLPTTGSNTAIVAGAAMLLLGAGVALFLVARRRRVRFTA